MNYFAHGRLYVDDPYFLAGTALPDWLNVSDRGVRVRTRHAEPFFDDADPRLAALARGAAQHHRDDSWFHETPAFSELCWQFTAGLRTVLGPDDGLRPSFVGHILVELLLDAELIAEDPPRLEAYYAAVGAVDGSLVERAVNRMAPTPAVRLAAFLPLFVRERFLCDYADDGRLWYRLNQVMRRVGLSPLPEALLDFLPGARREVAAKKLQLLTPVPRD